MCVYCDFSQEPKHMKQQLLDVALIETVRGTFHLQIDGEILSREINFCPICGRKLTMIDNPDLQ